MTTFTEARRRRQHPRYPLNQEVSLVTVGRQQQAYTALDVSQGGLFLVTEQPFELFTGVTLHVSMPNGRAVTWPARVVHILNVAKAVRLGVAPGIGVQFEGLSEAQLDEVRSLVDWARAHDPRPRVPRLKPGVTPSLLDSDPMLAYVLEHVDGRRDPEALADEVGLDVGSIEQLLRDLQGRQVLELVAAGAGHVSASVSPVAGASASAESAPLPPLSHAAASGHFGSEQQALLSMLEQRLLEGNFYNLLDVREDANEAAIRAGFQATSAALRVSSAPPAEHERVERMQNHLLDAYGTLSSPHKRHEYDQYLERGRQLDEGKAPGLRLSLRSRQPRAASASSAPSAANDAASAAYRFTAPSQAHRARLTGPLAAAAQLWSDAELALSSGRLAAAGKQLQVVKTALLADERVRERVAQLKGLLSRTLILDIEQQALYEESQQRWGLAARSWLRVAEGRPNESLPLQRAALAQLHAGIDLRQVMPVAKRAVVLADTDPRAHRILARVYLAAGMQAEARRELETARLCPAPPTAAAPVGTLSLLRRLLSGAPANR